MNKNVCPYCGGELIVEKVTDFEHCEEDGVATVSGYCEKCDREFEWEDVFIYSFSRHIEEKE